AATASLASRIEPETLQLYYQVGLIGRRDLPLAADPRSGFEMVLLRMLAFQPDDGGAIKSASTRPESVETPSPRPLSPSVSVDRNQEPGAVAMAQQSLPPEGQSTPLPSASDRSEEWHQIVNELGLSGMALELARNLVLEREGASKLVLTVAAATAGLMTERGKKQLDEVLRQRFGPTLKVEFRVSEAELETPAHRAKRAETERQLAAEHAIEHDDQIRDLRGRFDGQIEAGSIQPVKSQGTQE
ncbi:MAG: hypothetical protein J4A00_10990, partial [Gammaproteobacteria bacterium]|nr:hypothetical protein [Gammaproteobacteria bacterium]